MRSPKSDDYYHRHYGLTPPHTDVIEAMEHVSPSKTLDLGCGMGRNSLYLAEQGFTVTSVDHNSKSITSLDSIIEKETISAIKTFTYDINKANITEHYHFILSTVVFMFLQASRIPAIIQNMQDQTEKGGYNLLVSAMSTPQYPAPDNFTFAFAEGELAHYYRDWELVKYNEDLGELHRTDEKGNRLQLKFATMLARKKE